MNGSQELSQPQNCAPAAKPSIGKKRQRKKLDFETANKYLSYDPETGQLSRKIRVKGQKYENPQQRHGKNGYMRVACAGQMFQAHRVKWLLYYGFWPENDIDHINNDRIDNRIENLREVSCTCNMRNSVMQKNCTSGVTGVSYIRKDRKWMASISLRNKNSSLGQHTDFDEAVCHRLAAEQCLNWSSCRAETTAAAYVKRMTTP